MIVWPKNDVVRKVLKHPGNSVVGFLETGSADWPDDSFTARRIADGDIVLSDPDAKSESVSVSPGKVGKQ